MRRPFGWDFPPGCGGPPEDPPRPDEANQIYDILEAAGVAEDVIERVDAIVITIAERAARDCGACERRAAEAEASPTDWERTAARAATPRMLREEEGLA